MAGSSSISHHVQAVRQSLRRLERALAGLAAVARSARRADGPGADGPRKLRLSPARRRALRLQGRYLGYMRQLRPGQKAVVRATKKSKGMIAAIAKAKKLAGA
jgi:hypothetical protein